MSPFPQRAIVLTKGVQAYESFVAYWNPLKSLFNRITIILRKEIV